METTGIETHTVETRRKPLVFIEVNTDDGRVGLGEAAPNADSRTVGAALDVVGDRAVGTEVHATEQRFARTFNRSVLTPEAVPADPNDLADTTAASAVDIACWDLKAKDAGVPLYQLLGEPVRECLPAYANGWWQDVYREDDGGPGALASAAVDVVADGYDALKCNPFGWGPGWVQTADIDRAIERVAAIRDAVGPSVDLLVEGHKQFTPSVARGSRTGWKRSISRCSRNRRRRNPTNSHRSRRQPASPSRPVRACSRTTRSPICWTRASASSSPTRSGPVASRRSGRSRRWPTPSGCRSLRTTPAVPSAVCAHLGAAVHNLAYVEVFDDYVHPQWFRDTFDGLPVVHDGTLALPNGPGLGLTLDTDALSAGRE